MALALAPHAPTDLKQSRKCTATRRSGTRCTNWAIQGGTVCRMHGGGAPQVKAKAAERLRALVDPAITALQEILADKAHPQRLAAAREVLERDGRIGANKLQVEGGDGMVTYEQLEMAVILRRQKVIE